MLLYKPAHQQVLVVLEWFVSAAWYSKLPLLQVDILALQNAMCQLKAREIYGNTILARFASGRPPVRVLLFSLIA